MASSCPLGQWHITKSTGDCMREFSLDVEMLDILVFGLNLLYYGLLLTCISALMDIWVFILQHCIVKSTLSCTL